MPNTQRIATSQCAIGGCTGVVIKLAADHGMSRFRSPQLDVRFPVPRGVVHAVKGIPLNSSVVKPLNGGGSGCGKSTCEA